MLTRIYLDNFRSFINFEYRPKSKQLLLGQNGSGKSSLLEAIRILKQFVKGGSNGFTQSTRTRWQDRPIQVIELEAQLDGKSFEYRVEIKFAATTKEQSVNLERLTVAGATVFELADGQIRFFPNERSSMAVPLQTERSALQLSLLSNSDVRRFVEWLDRVHCFDIDAYPGKMDEVSDTEERQPDFELENLAGWYRYLVQTYPDENVKFLASLRECQEGFQALKFSSEDSGVRKLRAEFITPAKKRVSYSIAELSTGQRCLIALYMVLHFVIDRGDTVFLDEPDNFIALREIQPWLLAAEEAVEEHNCQLILVSHHPETLNQWAKEYGLRFFREENGHVRTEKFKTDQDEKLQPSDAGAGSGEQWVRERFPLEVQACRTRSAATKLIVLVDADAGMVQQRIVQLDQSLQQAGVTRIEGSRGQVARLVPKRNIETWILCLNDVPVNEEENYKRTRSDWSGLVRTATETLYQWIRPNASAQHPCIPSLQSGIEELLAIGATRL